MNDTAPEPQPAAPIDDALAAILYDESGAVASAFLERVTKAIDGNDQAAIREVVEPLHESELGHLLEALEEDYRIRLVALSGDAFDLTALTEVDEAVRLEIMDSLPNEAIAEAVQELDSDDAVYILEDLEEDDQEEILSKLPFEEQILLRRSLEYPEETAGRRMQTEFVAVPAFWSVGQTIDFLRNEEELPDRFFEVFVVNPTFELQGSVALDRMLRTKRDTRIEDIMEEASHPVAATLDQEEAAQIFEQYDLLSAAVVDESNRLVGVLTIDDVVDVIQQEAEEDIKRMGGVGDEELSDKVFEIFKSRFTWLVVNLITAVLASLVIGVFDATISQMVALAVLMPIVASMGGNAGTQTMTITVRALATRDLDIYNARRLISRELVVGFLNGILFAIIIGVVSLIWFSNYELGIIIGIAMVLNMVSAALAGILIPIVLDRLGVDPAVASSVFVTTVTDVVGFLGFLGLASIYLV